MRAESRNQKAEVRIQKSRVRNEKRNSKLENRDGSCFAASSLIIHHSSFRLICFLISAFCFLPSAFAGTHVTGIYSVGTSPAVMATVNGNSEYGLVFAQRNKSVTYNNVVYANNVVNTYLDINGNLNDGAGNTWIDLIPNANATPADSYYVVTINIQGSIHSEIWIVPDQANINVISVRQSVPPPSGGTTTPVFFYQTVQQAGSNLTQRPALNFTGAGVSCLDNAGLLRTDCTIAGSVAATPTISGTVKTDVLAADPVVYLKTSDDTLLAGKVGTSRQVLTAAPLSGGGTLTADVTLTCSSCVTSVSANSPLVSSGGTAPAISFASQNANLVAAGPASGGAGAPTFRALVGADLPTPSATTLGGVQSLGVVASKWINTISISGVPSATQPAFTDISGTATATQLPVTAVNSVVNDTNVTGSIATQALTLGWTGTLAKGRTLGATVYTDQANTFGSFLQKLQTGANFRFMDPTDTTKTAGFDLSNITTATTRTVNVPDANSTLAQSFSVVANQFLTSMSVQGVFSAAQPGFASLSGTASDSQLANPYSGAGGCAASKWASTLTRNAAPTCTQPAFADISGINPIASGGTGTSTAFTAGNVIFAGASGVYSQDNSGLFWDAANSRFLIGHTATSPSFGLLSLFASGADSPAAGMQFIIPESTIGSFRLGIQTDALRQNAYIKFMKLNAGAARSGAIAFFTSGANADAGTEAMRIDSNSNVGIGMTARTTVQLDVAKSAAFGLNTVTFSATPTFDASLGNTQKITLTANVTSSTLSNCAAGEWLIFDIIQDPAVARTFVWPANVLNAGTIGTTLSKHNLQTFYCDGTNARATAAMLINQN